jgi:hypothetical protein
MLVEMVVLSLSLAPAWAPGEAAVAHTPMVSGKNVGTAEGEPFAAVEMTMILALLGAPVLSGVWQAARPSDSMTNDSVSSTQRRS